MLLICKFKNKDFFGFTPTFYFRGLIFGLSEEQGKSAIQTLSRSLLIRAGMKIVDFKFGKKLFNFFYFL